MKNKGAIVARLGGMAKHPEADELGIFKADGKTVVVRAAEWKFEVAGIYIPVGAIVPDHRYFAFLNPNGALQTKHRRIGVKTIRGVESHGMMIPYSDAWVNWKGVPDRPVLGANVGPAMGVIPPPSLQMASLKYQGYNLIPNPAVPPGQMVVMPPKPKAMSPYDLRELFRALLKPMRRGF